MIIQLLAALVGSVGFAMLLNMRGKQVAYAGIGGIISWGIYLLGYQFTESYFIANFVAAVFVALYAEIMARVNRAPATIFLTAAAIPLIPGRNLYLSMYGIVTEDYVNARINGKKVAGLDEEVVMERRAGLEWLCCKGQENDDIKSEFNTWDHPDLNT